MIWPSPKDFNDAVRNPAAAFSDPDLAACDAVVGSNGRPTPHTGESSAVYQLCAEDGRSWAVKCFARPHDKRSARYAAIREALGQNALSFAVNFDLLEDGLLAGGQHWPVLKMDWVEGVSLNRVVRDRIDNPSVLDRLFKQWMQLSGELRTAGLAHGDLQHANVIFVPGKWPGAYQLKLVDYDGMYLPALANAPAYEAGHKNYQHPARNERTYSPDLDRFPLLVVGTALRALSVLGQSLWKRYGADDNVLFTAADFQDPAGSALMRQLWQSANPGLRALVGKLVLACAQPLPETPWIDQLAPEGADPKLTAEETRAVEAVLGGGAPAVVPLSAAFTLDDEPKPKPKPAAFTLDDEPKPVASRPARKAAALTPVAVLTSEDETDEEDEDPRARREARTRPDEDQEPRPFPLLAVSIVVGALLVATGVIAGVLLARGNKPDETVLPKPEDPAPKPAPAPGPGPGPQPKPPEPAPPEPKPPEPAPPPPFMGPPGFYRVWANPIEDERANVKPFFPADGGAVYVGLNQRIISFDAKTGKTRPELRGPHVPTGTLSVWGLDRDRVATFGYPHKTPGLFDAKTGEQLPPLLARDPLPPPPPGVQETAIEAQISPDAKYAFVGYQGPFQGQQYGAAPYRLVEVATGKVLAQGDWTHGSVRFTGDGSRMLMAETNGRVRWLKTATGEVEIEWAFQPNAFPRMISGMSADGSLVLYFGKPPGLPFEHYLMDGKTGQILRKLGGVFSGDRCVLSADGRWLAGIVPEGPRFQQFAAVVADTRTGEVLIHTPLEGGQADFQRAAFTPDGKWFALHHRGNHEIAVYELRGKVPTVQTVALPPPLTPIPARAAPGGPVGVVDPPQPPPPVAGPKGGRFPEAPALKARWTVNPDTGAMANQLPQAPLYSRDGRTVILSGGGTGTIHTFDAKTGKALATYDGHKGPGGVYWLAPFGDDRVVSGGFNGKRATWDTKTGQGVDDINFPDLPPLPPGQPGHAGITYTVSPSGRYTVAARREAARPTIAGPLRVLDTTTGKEVVSAGWNGGRVLFTADEARVFVLDGLGKAKWYKLPSGEADGEWATGEGQQAEQARVLGMTADGRTMLYAGPLAGRPFGVYLLEGMTGKIVQQIAAAPPYQVPFSTLAPDGKHIAIVVIDFARDAVWHVDVFEVATWKLVGRVSPPGNRGRESYHFAFSADGKSLGVYFPSAKELSMFEIPDK